MRQVLIIDDHDPDLLYGRLVVERAGIAEAVLTFGSGQEALDYLQHNGIQPVDVILLDINMPEMDGFEFLRRYEALAQERRHGAVVVMLTSSPDPRDRVRAHAFASVKAYLTKPLNLESARRLTGLLGGLTGAGRT